MEDLIPSLLDEKDMKSAWMNKPLQVILLILGFLVCFALSLLIMGVLFSLVDFIFLGISDYGKILFLGRAESFLGSAVLWLISFTLVLIIITILVSLFLKLYCKIRRIDSKKIDSNKKTKAKETREKFSKVEIIICILIIVVLLFFAYYGIFKQTTIFTEDKIYYSTFYHPVSMEYKYSDIENVVVDKEDGSNLKLEFQMNNDKIVKFSYTGDSHSDIEEYDNDDSAFIRDLVIQLREDNVPIEYKCTYDDVAIYCGEEYHDNLKIIFNE